MPRIHRLGDLIAYHRSAAQKISRFFNVERFPTLPGPNWFFTGRRSVRSLSLDPELVMLVGLLVALSGWFVLSLEPAAIAESERPVVKAQRPTNTPISEPFRFVSERSRNSLVPAMMALEQRANPPLAVLDPPVSPPNDTRSVDTHALLAEPLFDPLGTAVLSGLPKSSRLSAGALLSPQGSSTSDWAVAFGDLDHLIVALPRNRTGPIRTQIDLHTRAGLKFASLNVEVRDMPPVAVGSKRSTPAKVRPAKSSQNPAKARKIARAMPAAAVAKPTLSNSGKAVAAPPDAEVPDGPVEILWPFPFVLFPPDPKDSAASGLSPGVRDDPRFTTLRGLGMPPPIDLPPNELPVTVIPLE